ncbi:hypothetical protein A2774_04180 [Candidatus Roizmanbacteria bacterium RIFCSPHIGHO2_01_FULL_39_12c]|uniref:Aspartyl/glutamyl-tRNA(Asn/Gln) amidotransferase subunit C n=1 Tax=Candidatus Roizmanbacteria bacterium RIFCSPHIGHO2_01_FULL_39_12c TaxID=1802031 RepID=A0A1F7GEQ5_9BACT|nr:MAG: hypothetical protein A2774_04180 [Candidatus Roizmanbacteria bacterium RIFCSPHIGHO2_01_FULL_39_12c]OGK48091.1 MAG: hypothetical protein A2963_03995 [Candidatus Roizmanbacteria bacterium RIFCSPLOWO2_01_FULL_40_13]
MKKIELTREDILHLAKLSSLKLTDQEVEKYCNQLGETVEFVKNLKELKTDVVIPTSQITNLTDVFFTDGETNKRVLTKEKATENAKYKKEKYFVVKRIM